MRDTVPNMCSIVICNTLLTQKVNIFHTRANSVQYGQKYQQSQSETSTVLHQNFELGA